MTSPIRPSPEPQFDEKRVLSELAESQTGEYEAAKDPWRVMRALARRAKARDARRWKEIFGAIAGLVTAICLGIAGIVKAFGAHDRVSLNEYRLDQGEAAVKQLKADLDHARLKLERCRCPKEE